MGDMLIRDIPEPLKREIEHAARKGGQSLSGKAIDLLRKGMVAEKEAKPEPGLSAWDAIRLAFTVENAIGDEFSRIMDEIEADRKHDFGRPVEDFEMIVLDTNVVSEASKPVPDSNVIAWFRRQDLLALYMCGPVIMEQSFGAERFLNKTGSDRYVRVLDHLISEQFSGRIVEFSDSIPRLAGKLRATRERNGPPISLSDAMIAAICLAHDATLATRNDRDFDGLDLKITNPFEADA